MFLDEVHPQVRNVFVRGHQATFLVKIQGLIKKGLSHLWWSSEGHPAKSVRTLSRRRRLFPTRNRSIFVFLAEDLRCSTVGTF